MELREALCQIEEIRDRIAATEQFHGYRAIPIALSGVIAMVAAIRATIHRGKAIAGTIGISSLLDWRGIYRWACLDLGLDAATTHCHSPLESRTDDLGIESIRPLFGRRGFGQLGYISQRPGTGWSVAGALANPFQLGNLCIVPATTAVDGLGWLVLSALWQRNLEHGDGTFGMRSVYDGRAVRVGAARRRCGSLLAFGAGSWPLNRTRTTAIPVVLHSRESIACCMRKHGWAS